MSRFAGDIWLVDCATGAQIGESQFETEAREQRAAENAFDTLALCDLIETDWEAGCRVPATVRDAVSGIPSLGAALHAASDDAAALRAVGLWALARLRLETRP